MLPPTWRYIGDATVAQLTDDRRAVIRSLEHNGVSSPAAVATDTGLRYENVKKLMPRMASDGEIKNLAGGRYEPLNRGIFDD